MSYRSLISYGQVLNDIDDPVIVWWQIPGTNEPYTYEFYMGQTGEYLLVPPGCTETNTLALKVLLQVCVHFVVPNTAPKATAAACLQIWSPEEAGKYSKVRVSDLIGAGIAVPDPPYFKTEGDPLVSYAVDDDVDEVTRSLGKSEGLDLEHQPPSPPRWPPPPTAEELDPNYPAKLDDIFPKLSALMPCQDGAENYTPSLFALATTMLLLIGLKECRSSQKPVQESNEPLVQQ